MGRRRKARISNVRLAGPDHAVLTSVQAKGSRHAYRREPCQECPWRRDSPVGAFPAEAYRLSASTAYDMASNVFACHMSGREHPATCAGFLLRGSRHNFGVRMNLLTGHIDPGQVSSRDELYDSYREMAEANGVDPEDPVLGPCR